MERSAAVRVVRRSVVVGGQDYHFWRVDHLLLVRLFLLAVADPLFWAAWRRDDWWVLPAISVYPGSVWRAQVWVGVHNRFKWDKGDKREQGAEYVCLLTDETRQISVFDQ